MKRRTFIVGAATAAVAPHLSAAPSARLRVGQVGTMHPHAAGKMLAMRGLPAIWDVAGVVETDPQRRSATASAAAYKGLPQLTEEGLLGMRDVKVVAIETRVQDTCAAAHRAIRAGKHVHLDKPGAMRHDEFKAMRMEAHQRGLAVQMGYMLRYNPAFEMLFRIVREGWLGEVMEIDAVMGKLGNSSLRSEIAAFPGGGMFELGCHVIDAAMTVLGKPQSVAAFSTPTRDDGVKDNQLAVLHYPRATATIRVNFSDPFGSPRRRFNVTGTEGTFEILPLESGNVKLSLTTARETYRKGQQELQLPRAGGRYDEEFIDLARVVRGEKQLAWDAAHDIAVHEAVLRASSAWPAS